MHVLAKTLSSSQRLRIRPIIAILQYKVGGVSGAHQPKCGNGDQVDGVYGIYRAAESNWVAITSFLPEFLRDGKVLYGSMSNGCCR